MFLAPGHLGDRRRWRRTNCSRVRDHWQPMISERSGSWPDKRILFGVTSRGVVYKTTTPTSLPTIAPVSSAGSHLLRAHLRQVRRRPRARRSWGSARPHRRDGRSGCTPRIAGFPRNARRSRRTHRRCRPSGGLRAAGPAVEQAVGGDDGRQPGGRPRHRTAWLGLPPGLRSRTHSEA